MPLYEYYCRRCEGRFELLRPAGRMDDPATCPQGHKGGERVLSMFAAFSQGDGGEGTALAGNPCAGCSSGACSTCALN
jgi:putative FmdB family regulatory protein